MDVTKTHSHSRTIRSGQDRRRAGSDESNSETDGIGGARLLPLRLCQPAGARSWLEYEMSGSNVLIALNLGFDVVFDGNFTAEDPDPFLDRLFSAHPRENYLFYLDATLHETLKRRATKLNPRISTKKMREVYRYASPTGRPEEVVIPQTSSLDQTVEQIIRTTGI
jgi:hypothetical protein